MSTTPPTKVSWGKSALWSLIPIALIPAGLGLLWVVGHTWKALTGWASRLGITWGDVAWGAVVVVAYLVLVAVVHAVRTHRARRAEIATYQAVTEVLVGRR